VGVTEPQAAFSSCYGAAFMSQKPSVYASILADKMKSHKTRCILLNTGWSGGPYGVGKRISIKLTRSLLNAALDGSIDDKGTVTHPVFNLKMPKAVDGIDSDMLDPRNTWSDKDAYDAQASKLRELFRKNYDTKGYQQLGIEAVM
jgi:phosphoenolpyruvate carboxykinase (ATP)